jgi:two-component system phosphate regulon response regulator PhoB
MADQGSEFAQRGTAQRVLIVDQACDAAQALQARLAQAGFIVSTEEQSERVPSAIKHNSPHIVMLDWDLPGMIAIDLIRRIRSTSSGMPPRLMILSKLSGDDQIVTGLELGADDYVVKPFSVSEVVARVRAILRTGDSRQDDSPVVRYHDLELWVEEGRVRVRDAIVQLRSMEYRVLEFLMRHPGRAFSRSALLERVWGGHSRAQERAVDVVVQRIRKSLADHRCEGYVQTIRSVGYRLEAEPEPTTHIRPAGVAAVQIR